MTALADLAPGSAARTAIEGGDIAPLWLLELRPHTAAAPWRWALGASDATVDGDRFVRDAENPVAAVVGFSRRGGRLAPDEYQLVLADPEWRYFAALHDAWRGMTLRVGVLIAGQRVDVRRSVCVGFAAGATNQGRFAHLTFANSLPAGAAPRTTSARNARRFGAGTGFSEVERTVSIVWGSAKPI